MKMVFIFLVYLLWVIDILWRKIKIDLLVVFRYFREFSVEILLMVNVVFFCFLVRSRERVGGFLGYRVLFFWVGFGIEKGCRERDFGFRF